MALGTRLGIFSAGGRAPRIRENRLGTRLLRSWVQFSLRTRDIYVKRGSLSSVESRVFLPVLRFLPTRNILTGWVWDKS
jgi:hypothetical protein